jgi:hypothetical protein
LNILDTERADIELNITDDLSSNPDETPIIAPSVTATPFNKRGRSQTPPSVASNSRLGNIYKITPGTFLTENNPATKVYNHN